METNIIKLKSEKLEGTELKGNFLYEENGEFYFTDKFNHAIFELDKNYKNYDENHSMNFDEYVQKFMGICSKVKNKPSLLFLNYIPKNIIDVLNGKDNNYKQNYHFLNGLNEYEEFKKFNEKPCVVCVQEGFIDVLKNLTATRSKNIPQTDAVVIFNKPEDSHNLKDPSLETIVATGRSRKIYFIFNFVNSASYVEKYGKDSFVSIKDNCKIKL